MLVALVMVCMLSTIAITYLMSTVTIHGGSDVRPPLSERDKMRGCKTVLKCLKEIHGVELDLEECFEILERVHEGVEKEPELWSKKKMPLCILGNLKYADIEYTNSLRKESIV